VIVEHHGRSFALVFYVCKNSMIDTMAMNKATIEGSTQHHDDSFTTF
jgi:hypothetical protein